MLQQSDYLESRLVDYAETHNTTKDRIDNLEDNIRTKHEEIWSTFHQLSENQALARKVLESHGTTLDDLLEASHQLNHKLTSTGQGLQASDRKINVLDQQLDKLGQEISKVRTQVSEQQHLMQGLSRALSLKENDSREAIAETRVTLTRKITALTGFLIAQTIVFSAVIYF